MGSRRVKGIRVEFVGLTGFRLALSLFLDRVKLVVCETSLPLFPCRLFLLPIFKSRTSSFTQLWVFRSRLAVPVTYDFSVRKLMNIDFATNFMVAHLNVVREASLLVD